VRYLETLVGALSAGGDGERRDQSPIPQKL